MLRGSRHLGKILGDTFSPIKVPPLAAWISHVAYDVETSGGDSGNFWITGCTVSLMAAVQPEPWFQALITTTTNGLNQRCSWPCTIEQNKMCNGFESQSPDVLRPFQKQAHCVPSFSKLFVSKKELYPISLVWLKAGIDLEWAFLITCGPSLPEPSEKYLLHVRQSQVPHMKMLS
jgi:hypothetical protein